MGDSPTDFVDPLGLISRKPTYLGLPPGYEGPCEKHHIIPKYLGGDENGPTFLIPKDYHQKMTNQFRALAPYGGAKPTPAEMLEILLTVYDLLPIVLIPLL